MATAQQLLTVEEFARLPDDGRPMELVRGEVVEMNLPKPRHGQVCGNVYFQVRMFCEPRNLGHVLANDAGMLTEQDPDSARGPDVSFVSYLKAPPGPLSRDDYLRTPVDVAFEVLSPDDRPGRTLNKINEYLRAGVTTVVVVDPDDQCVFVHESGKEFQTLERDATLTLPVIAPDCSIPVALFFQ